MRGVVWVPYVPRFSLSQLSQNLRIAPRFKMQDFVGTGNKEGQGVRPEPQGQRQSPLLRSWTGQPVPQLPRRAHRNNGRLACAGKMTGSRLTCLIITDK